MVYQGMQSFKAENQRKTVLLLTLFPMLLFLIFWVIASFFLTESYGLENMFKDGWNITMYYFPRILVIIGVRGLVSFFFQKDIMFGLSGAKAITRKDNPEIYNIVENLCITKGLPMPKIAIMDEEGMNAFATGWKQEDSWVAFTSGLLKNLNKSEIEAVAGHELTHLINKDSLLMYVAYVFVGIVSVVGQYILRFGGTGSSNNKKSGGFILLLGIALLLLGYLFYPLVRLAISRKREYMADLGSVELTRDNEAMISALRKISNHSYVSRANNSISSFFIAEPKKPSDVNWNGLDVNTNSDNLGKKKIKTSIWDSHPSIDDRISRLQSYR